MRTNGVDDLNLGMFRANDIRTPARRLTDELALRLARAEACYIRNSMGARGVVIAHDARASGPRLTEIALSAYAQAGLDCVLLPGVTGVCQFYYACMRHADLAGVFVGASHNPAGDTGRKIVGPGLTPIAADLGPEGGLTRLAELYKVGASDRSDTPGRVSAFDALPGYVAYSVRHAQVEPGGLRRVRILHDYLNAAGGRELMLGFAPSGAQLVPLHAVANPMFPLGDPNPVKQDVIAHGLETLRAGDFDLGMFFDGDADRLDVYLGDGTLLSSSFVYATILPFILRRMYNPKYHDLSPIAGVVTDASPIVYTDTKSNPLAIAEMAAAGVEPRIIRSGHSHIKHAMYGDPRAIGTVEESAHYYEAFTYEGHRYCTENTLYFALMVARAWRDDPDRFRHLARVQASSGREREWGHVFPDDAFRSQALAAVREHFAALGAQVTDRMADGTPMQSDFIRYGIPSDAPPSGDWLQISQRVSQSEDHLARWEVMAGSQALASETKAAIQRIVKPFGAGPEYQG